MKTLLKSLPVLLVLFFSGAPADAAKQTYKSGDPTPNIRCSELRHCIIRFPAGVEFIEYILSDPPSWIVEAGTYGRDQRYFVAARPRLCGTTSLLTIPTTEDLFQAVLVAEPCDLKGPGVGDDLQILRDKLATPIEVPAGQSPSPGPGGEGAGGTQAAAGRAAPERAPGSGQGRTQAAQDGCQRRALGIENLFHPEPT